MTPTWAIVYATVVCCTLSSVLAGPSAAPTHLWRDLRVKYSYEGAAKGFYQMPRTVADARAKGYVHPPESYATPPADIDIFCPPNDPTVCLIYDKKGIIAGMQIGVQKKGLVKTGYPFEKHHSFQPDTRFGFAILKTTLFFVPQSVLKAGGRTSLANHGTGTGLWLQDGPDRTKMFEIPRFEKDIGKTLYKKQGCMNGMGYHYYYDFSENMKCEKFHPIFGLYNNGEMVGFGFNTFGKQTSIAKTWFEDFPPGSLAGILPRQPQCLIDRGNANEIISLHTYFGDQPWNIKC